MLSLFVEKVECKNCSCALTVTYWFFVCIAGSMIVAGGMCYLIEGVPDVVGGVIAFGTLATPIFFNVPLIVKWHK